MPAESDHLLSLSEGESFQEQTPGSSLTLAVDLEGHRPLRRRSPSQLLDLLLEFRNRFFGLCQFVTLACCLACEQADRLR